MGIDKSLGTWNSIAIINGDVWQYGRVDTNQYTGEAYEKPEWLVEHFSYAKWYHCFRSEEEMRDYLDALPESEERVASDHPRGWEYRPKEEVAEIAARRRAEGFEDESRLEIFEGQLWEELSAEDRRKAAFIDDVRCAIMAVCLKHLKPCRSREDDVSDEIKLIIADAVRRYGAKLNDPERMPKDYKNKDVRHKYYGDHYERMFGSG
jgi:hypothetical protein